MLPHCPVWWSTLVDVDLPMRGFIRIVLKRLPFLQEIVMLGLLCWAVSRVTESRVKYGRLHRPRDPARLHSTSTLR